MVLLVFFLFFLLGSSFTLVKYLGLGEGIFKSPSRSPIERSQDESIGLSSNLWYLIFLINKLHMKNDIKSSVSATSFLFHSFFYRFCFFFFFIRLWFFSLSFF